MKMTSKFLIAGVSLVAVAFAQGSAQAARSTKDGATKDTAVSAAAFTPPGITLQPLGKGQGYDLGKQTAAFLLRDEIVFANEKGMTLYTYVPDVAGSGKSACVAECTAKWKPFAAPSGFKPTGAWSTITREDGFKQVALAGKPIYTFVDDVDPGSVHGNSPAKTGARRIDGAGRVVGGGNRGSGVRGVTPDVPLPAEWKTANAFPIAGIETPSGIQVREVPDAAGVVLANHEGRSLYAFNGAPKKAPVGGSWKAAPAPQFAKKIGDFDFITRADGIKQWTYQGKALYTYEFDTASGDAYGIGQDAKFDIAAVSRFYMPATVKMQHTPGQGKVMATAEGQTLYRREGHIIQSGGGRSLRRGNPARPAVGRDIGTDPRCSAECLVSWKPFLAPADAQSQGFWTVATRADGQKQWVYQGYAMWTYTGDRKPGDMNGNDDYQYAFADTPNMVNDAPKPSYDFGTWMDGAPAMYWVIATP
jgi:predicted lipoprotein with Yx(FWY)xxD motif